jgi:MFS family permease
LEQSTPTRILVLFTVTLLPYSLIGPFTGVFVDRWSRRRLLVWTNVCRSAALLSLPVWSQLGAGDAALYGGVLVLMGLGRLFLATKGAALPGVVGEQRLLSANSVSSGGGMVAALLGGVVGVGVVAAASPTAAYVVSGAFYAAAAVSARFITSEMRPRRPAAVGQELRRVAAEMVAGVAEVWRRERARLPLAGIFVLRVTAIFVAIAAILVIKRDFPETGDRLGRLSASAIALGAAGVGAFAGALTAPWLGRRWTKPQLLLAGFAVSAAAMIVAGAALSLAIIVGVSLVGGYGTFVAKVSVDAQVQEALPDTFRGRAFALYDILYNLASITAAAVVVIFAAWSLRLLLLGMGLATLGLAALLGTAMRRSGLLAAA